jgi:hypothetical protein
MIKVILGERVFLYPTGIFHRRRYELIFEREHTSNMEGSLATALRSAPTKESPAPVVSTGLTENPPTFPLNFCNQIISPKIINLIESITDDQLRKYLIELILKKLKELFSKHELDGWTVQYLSDISATLLSISNKKQLQLVMPQRHNSIFILRIFLCKKFNFIITHLC